MEQEDLIHKQWSIHLAVLDQFWKKGCGELVKAEKMVRKKFVLIFVSAAANTYLSCYPSNRRRINGLRRTAITYPLVCTLSRKMMRNWKKTKTRIFAKLPSFHFTPSPGTRAPMTMGEAVVGQSLAWGNTMKYTQQSRMIERNPPQHSTRNYWKCFCCNKRRSQAGGQRNCLIRMVKNAHTELNNDTDDGDHDENNVVTSSMNNSMNSKAHALLIGRSVNNNSHIASEFAYHDMKKEPV